MNPNHVTIGIDLGDRRHSVCVLSAGGEILAEEMIPNSRECLSAFAQRHAGAVFVMETGTHSPWVSRLLESLGHTVHVANARKVRAISTSPNKSDQEDARMLARLGRADPALLSPVKHRSESAQRALVRLKVREALVRGRVNAMNTVRFLVKSLGLQVPRGVKATAFVRKFRLQAGAADTAFDKPVGKLVAVTAFILSICFSLMLVRQARERSGFVDRIKAVEAELAKMQPIFAIPIKKTLRWFTSEVLAWILVVESIIGFVFLLHCMGVFHCICEC